MTGLQEEIQAVDQRFYETPNKDVEEWCDKFKEAYNTNGLPNDDAQRYRIAKTQLMVGASDWYRTEGAAITGWAANDNTSLRHEIMEKYVSNRIKHRWLEKLEKIKQLKGEIVDKYYIRFKYLLKRAGGNAALAAGNQKRIFIRKLNADHIKDVIMGNLEDLARALELAKASERGYDALKGKFKQEEEQEPVVKPKEVIKNQDKYDIDDLTRDFARLRVSDEAKMVKMGHYARDCSERRRYNRRVNVLEECDEYEYMDNKDQVYEDCDDRYEGYDELYYNDRYDMYPVQTRKKEGLKTILCKSKENEEVMKNKIKDENH
ncbi:hypothetical protein C1646_770047 [Rhizophagus diaphanus]|nr:hypothetical protein C1646_770047 [Rhizophagus diaphanus] [Rhizophagus sp. MUCL 43196]